MTARRARHPFSTVSCAAIVCQRESAIERRREPEPEDRARNHSYRVRSRARGYRRGPEDRATVRAAAQTARSFSSVGGTGDGRAFVREYATLRDSEPEPGI